MSIMTKGVGGSKKKIILAPCRFTGYATDCWRFYSNYLKRMNDSFTIQKTDYYANYIKVIGELLTLDSNDYYSNYIKTLADQFMIQNVEYYSNYIKSLNGFFIPTKSTVYVV